MISKKQLIKLAGIWATGRITMIIAVYIAVNLFPFNGIMQKSNFNYKEAKIEWLNYFNSWDGQWYAYLADYGYGKELAGELNQMKYVFFPLFPAIIRVIKPVFNEVFMSGWVLNQICWGFALLLMFELIKLDENEEVSFESVKLLVYSPMVIFFSAIYTEALFLCLSLIILWLARKKYWMIANIMTVLVVLTRAQGILLIVPVLCEWIRDLYQNKPGLFKILVTGLSFCLIPLTLYGYGIFLSGYTGKLTITLDSMQYFGRLPHNLLNIPLLIWVNIKYFITVPLHSYHTSQLDFITIILVIFFQLGYVKKIRLSYTLYGLVLALMPLFSGKTTSFMRYIAVSMPMYLIIAKTSNKHKFIGKLWMTISIMLSTVFTILFVNWYWVG